MAARISALPEATKAQALIGSFVAVVSVLTVCMRIVVVGV